MLGGSRWHSRAMLLSKWRRGRVYAARQHTTHQSFLLYALVPRQTA